MTCSCRFSEKFDGKIGRAASPARKSTGGEGIRLPEPQAVRTVMTTNLRMYTLGELRSATKNFRPDTMLGEGGFGRVFKGWVDEKTLAPATVGAGIPVAVKKSNPDSEQGLEEWRVHSPSSLPVCKKKKKKRKGKF